MMKLAIEPLVPNAFAPFGTVVRSPEGPARTIARHWIEYHPFDAGSKR
jgi:ureidoglycolate hydrolase